jgi:toxin ParE1/3/4
MRVVWLARAQRELSAIRAYIATEDPEAANRVAARIVQAAMLLEGNRKMGRRGLLFDTREWVVYP